MRPGSLLVFDGMVYEDRLHGIAEVKQDLVSDHVVNADAAGVEVSFRYA